MGCPHDQIRPYCGRQDDQSPIEEHSHEKCPHDAARDEEQTVVVTGARAEFLQQRGKKISSGNEATGEDCRLLEEDRRERAGDPRNYGDDEYYPLRLAVQQTFRYIKTQNESHYSQKEPKEIPACGEHRKSQEKSEKCHVKDYFFGFSVRSLAISS
jgi:hypothetical protein